ncbi:tumor necrosis factor receptor type 1-associated DEATH domain protein isoform X2 [Stegostoma tigrinum]|nr:tumor necrosis factor receptor type 1-associated DEATH domain protein isoform X2 [Stegostoma tigrinum]XP_048402560.1 tumor necrosis factor receptor type 1-associated DEATH domain protein isoform X2 [Stegostoma tigrinum]XP_048402561.1 tumor necrosis factor receptor type 1-associated DEATH domain protein isoform X2 [Stegostoma tigrinum]XP_048402562.1 tumor necrosis factor receptor type 1-associated DEATH domain protein isoform X2 [Stegostoma tigrinum]
MDSVTPAWVGSVFLFIHSDETDLSALYQEPQLRLKIYKALKLTLADAAGSSAGFEILKIYGSGFGLELKFTEEKKCRNFLHNYRNDKLQQALAYHFGNQCMPNIACRTVLKAGTVTLDDILDNTEGCLRHIKENEPNHLRDDEISRLEEDIRRMVLEYSSNCQSSETHCSVNSKTPTAVSTLSPISLPSSSPSSIEANGSLLCSTDRFEFQGVLFDDRVLTSEDHYTFAKTVGRKWKEVGRLLKKTCRGLRDPTIDNIAFEYEREGLYEQAYQLLLKFMQCEGKKATMSRLVKVLEESELVGVAEQLLDTSSN